MKKTLCVILALAAVFSTVFACFAAGAKGDVDDDGAVTAADARLVLRYAVGLDPFTRAQLEKADMNADKSIDASDARRVLRVAVMLEDVDGNPITTTEPPETTTVESKTTTRPDEQTSVEVTTGKRGEDPEDVFKKVVPDAPSISPGHDTFTFIIYGNGHSVGMSQRAAIYMGAHGADYLQILDRFYVGVKHEKETPPESVLYPDTNGNAISWDTFELLARIVEMEIDGNSSVEALKAQAVAVYTNIKRYNYRVTSRNSVGYACHYWSSVTENTQKACREVLGEYMSYKGNPIYAVYSDVTAGATCSAASVWGGDYPYLQPVSVPSDLAEPASVLIRVKTYSADEIESLINAYDSSIVLPADKSEWIKVLSHNGCIDSDRGYVTRLQIGNKVFEGSRVYNSFCCNLMRYRLSSHAFTVTYTP